MVTSRAVGDCASAGFQWNCDSSAKAIRLLLAASSGEHRLQEALMG